DWREYVTIDERYFRPAELLLGLRVVPDQQVDLGRAEVPLVDRHVLAPVELRMTERLVEELLDRMRLTGREDEVVGLVDLQHPPRAVHVIPREAPVAFSL